MDGTQGVVLKKQLSPEGLINVEAQAKLYNFHIWRQKQKSRVSVLPLYLVQDMSLAVFSTYCWI